MDKKPLIGISILAVVLLVLGSLSNVSGYQISKNSKQNMFKGDSTTSSSAESEQLKLIDMWTLWDTQDWGYYLGLRILNNGSETIHTLHAVGDWNYVFFPTEGDYHHDDYWRDAMTLKPQETSGFYIFILPFNPYFPHHFLKINVRITVDVPGYNSIYIDSKYSYDNGRLTPMSGGWLWLANLLGR